MSEQRFQEDDLDGSDGHEVVLGIVTPTYNRAKLLTRFLRRLQNQKFNNWVIAIVHDGPSDGFEQLSKRFSDDVRMTFASTARRYNDCGNTPRFEGVKILQNLPSPPVYVVFWDDDNYFYRHSLEAIVDLTKQLGQPELFLVGMKYHGRILPPKDAPVALISPGQIDTANFVVRPNLALEAYGSIINEPAFQFPEKLLISDFLVFSAMRTGRSHVPSSRDVVIGYHDGLRWGPYFRNIFGMKPLRLASKPWVRKITAGRFKNRPAGGLD